MYIRKNTRKYKDRTYTNHLLVESVHTPEGPRQRTVCSLGDLKPRSRANWLKLVHQVEEALVGQGELFEAGAETKAIASEIRARKAEGRPAKDARDSNVIRVLAEGVETERHREAGPEHVGLVFWERLGLGEVLADSDEIGGFEEVLRVPSPTNPFQKKSTIHVKRASCGDETYVFCISAERSEKDRAIRESHERRLLADLAKLQVRIDHGRLVKSVKIGEAMGRIKERYPRVARYYAIAYDEKTRQFTYPVDAAKRAQAQELDGSYLLRTDRTDLAAEDFWRIYMLLTRAENAFRDLKSPLVLRPIHHQVQTRADTHIFLSILAYHILVAIEKTLLDQDIHVSWETLRDLLRTHQVCTVVLPTDNGTVLRIRKASTPEPIQRQIYDLLRITTPIVQPRKTWTEPKNRA